MYIVGRVAELDRRIGKALLDVTDNASCPSRGNAKLKYSWGYTLKVRVLSLPSKLKIMNLEIINGIAKIN